MASVLIAVMILLGVERLAGYPVSEAVERWWQQHLSDALWASVTATAGVAHKRALPKTSLPSLSQLTDARSMFAACTGTYLPRAEGGSDVNVEDHGTGRPYGTAAKLKQAE